MSNRVYIQPCKFEDVRTGEITFGYRFFDSYAMTYGNGWDSIPDDDMEVIRLVWADDHTDQISFGLWDAASTSGICVGDIFYEWQEIDRYLKDRKLK